MQDVNIVNQTFFTSSAVTRVWQLFYALQ